MKCLLLKMLFLFIPIAATYLPCRAQELEPIELGVKAGVNLSNLYTNDASVSDMIYGFNAGVYIKAPVSKIIAFQPEFYVTTKGASIRYNDPLLDGTARFNLTYLELPILCEIQTSRHFKLEVGSYIACLVGAKVTNMTEINLFDYEKNVDETQFNRVDAGLVIGAGVVSHSVTVGVRYSYGFTKVGRQQSYLGSSYTIPNTNNGVVGFYMTIPLNKMVKNPVTKQYALTP
jgi:hypothetical protein